MQEVTKARFIELLRQQIDIKSVELKENFNEVTGGISSSKSVRIEDSKFRDLFLPQFSFQSLEFVRCQIETLNLSSDYKGKVGFSECDLTSLSISGGTLGLLEINKTIISGSIELKNSAIESISILDSSFSALNISSPKTAIHLAYERSPAASKPVSITIGGSIASIRFNDVRIASIAVKNALPKGNLQFVDTDISDGQFDFEPHSHIVKLENVSSKENLEFKAQAGTYTVEGGTFNRLKIRNDHGNLRIQPRFDVEDNMRIQILDLSDSKESKGLGLKGLSIDSVLLDNASINGATIEDIEIKNVLSLQRSNIQNAKFHNVDLGNANIKMIKTTLPGCELINVEWSKGYEFYSFVDERREKSVKEELKILWALKESYRQMKVLSLIQHNKVDALYFQKQELNAFWRVIRIKTFRESYASFWRYLGNWFILGTNKLFSDFGQNIWRPLLALFVTHMIFFNLLLIVRFNVYPFIYGADSDLTMACFNGFFATLLPTHGTELDIGLLSGSIGGWIDFFMRVFSAYFIFYFLYSSRKFHQ